MANPSRIALIPEEEGIVNIPLLLRTAVAIDTQVREHLRPIWPDVADRTVVACPTMDEVQPNDWHVFLVKEDRGPDHWLQVIPDRVLSVIRRA